MIKQKLFRMHNAVGIAITMIFAIVALSACNDNSMRDYRIAAAQSLRDYAITRGRGNFTSDNWLIVQGYIDGGVVAIEVAETKPEVHTVLNNTKQNIDAVIQNGGGSMLNAEVENRIRRDAMTVVFKNIPKNQIFFFYYGTFDESIVVMMQSPQANWGRMEHWDIFNISNPSSIQTVCEQEWIKYRDLYPEMFQSVEEHLPINGQFIEIRYPNTNCIRVWNDGSFYRLAEAVERNLLSADDLELIARIHYDGEDDIYRKGAWR